MLQYGSACEEEVFLKILGKFLQSTCKVLQFICKVKVVIQTFENICKTRFYGNFTRLLVKICGGIYNLLNLLISNMHSFTCKHPHSIKRTWETGNLKGVGNFAWRNFFTWSGRGIRWALVLTIWPFCYAENWAR